MGPEAICGKDDAQKRKLAVRGRNSTSLKTEATTGSDQVSPASVLVATWISPMPSWESSSVESIQATCTVPSAVTSGWLPCTTRRVPKTLDVPVSSPLSP